MNRSKKLYVLLGVLAAVCVVTFAASRIEERKEQIKNSDEIIMELDTDAVETLSWKCESGDYAFHKDEIWLYDEDETFPVSEEKIEELLEEFENFGVSFIIEDVEDYGQYGLDAPVCTINLSTADTDYEIQLGDYSTMDSERYVSIGDGNVYLVQNDPLDLYDVALSDLIDNDETPTFSDVSEITFTGAADYQINYQEEGGNSYREDDVYFTKQDGTSQPLDTTKVNSYLKSIRYLDLTDYVTYNAEESDLATYGLDNPELTVTVQYTPDEDADETDTGSFTLSISRDPKELAEAKAAQTEAEAVSDTEESESASVAAASDTDEEEITAYARVGESKIIYQLTADDYKTLMAAAYDDLRHDEIVPAEFENITQIDITLDGENYTLTSDGSGDDRTWYYGEEELTMDDLQSALSALSADSFTDKKSSEKEEIGLTLTLDGDSEPQVEITLYRYDGSDCLAEVDGKPVALVERSLVVDLVEAVNAIVLN
jgi:hypothetical protein